MTAATKRFMGAPDRLNRTKIIVSAPVDQAGRRPVLSVDTLTLPPRNPPTLSANTANGQQLLLKPYVLTDIEHEIEPASETVAGVRYPHQQRALEQTITLVRWLVGKV